MDSSKPLAKSCDLNQTGAKACWQTIKPLALRCVYEAARAIRIPVIGVGGISNGRDAAEMLMAGASAVQVCTEAILRGPMVYAKIAGELNKFLDEHNDTSVDEIRGLRPGTVLLLDGHIDKVPVPDESKWTHAPYGDELADGRIYGRGTSDMRARSRQWRQQPLSSRPMRSEILPARFMLRAWSTKSASGASRQETSARASSLISS
jgi:tRNA-dihydrouridine synthase